MDRRHFLNMFLAAPALAPLLMAAKQTGYSSELYLISDEPQESLPQLMTEFSPVLVPEKNTFAFLTPHPRARQLRAGLTGLGWREEFDPSLAHLTLSFSLLGHLARPSFTMVQHGRIKDVRSHKLRILWDRLGQRGGSSSLTTAGFRPDPPASIAQGQIAAIFQDGSLKTRLPLNKTAHTTYHTQAGKVTVLVEKGRASIVQSPCRHRICQNTPPVSLSGERIICAPSHFFLEIQGSSGLDTVIG